MAERDFSQRRACGLVDVDPKTERRRFTQLLARRCAKVVAVALANKSARTVCAMMVTGESYSEPLAV